MSIDTDKFTIEIVKNRVIVYKNRKQYRSMVAPDVVNAFIEQDEIVLEYENPRTRTQRFQTLNFRLQEIRSGGGKYFTLRSRARKQSSIGSDSDVDQSRSSGGFGASVVVFLLVTAWAFYSIISPNISLPTFDEDIEAHRPDENSGADSVFELPELQSLTEFPTAFLGTWDVIGQCNNEFGGDTRLTINRDTALFHEAKCKPISLRFSGSTLTSPSVCVGEGEAWNQEIALELRANSLIDYGIDRAGFKRVRCGL